MINITIQSLNGKSIDVTNLDTFSKIYTNVSTNQTINSAYSNLIIDIKTSSASFNVPNFFNNLRNANQDLLFFVILIICIIMIFSAIKLLKVYND